ncbi:MAG: lactate dehydrogenase [bacterium]|nr:lactate dehydrogenase [bacterium]
MKVAIVGVGRVGATLAFLLVERGIVDELVLVDADARVAEGEALDLVHAQAFTHHRTNVSAGSVEETAGSDIIVLACSAPWRGEYKSRFELGRANMGIFRELVPVLAERSPGAKMLVISNPADVMTYHTLRLSGFGWERVFGTGTLIDSARFRMLLSRALGIHPDDVRAYILGEHGETQFPEFSLAVVGGTRIVDDAGTRALFRETTRAGFEVVERKGHTSYAISMAAALVIEAIALDTRRTMPLSVLVDGYLGVRDVCLSLPVVVGRSGIVRVLYPELSGEEAAAFRRCAEVVRAGIDETLGGGG